MAIKKEELYTRLVPIWLDSCIRSFAYIIGAGQIKTFLKGGTEAYMLNLLNYLDEKGIKIDTASSVKDSVLKLGDLFNKAGIYDKNDLEFEEDKVTFGECIYADMCGEILYELMSSGQFTKKQLPCIRSDEVLAYLKTTQDQKGRYDMESFQPGVKCVSKLDLI